MTTRRRPVIPALRDPDTDAPTFGTCDRDGCGRPAVHHTSKCSEHVYVSMSKDPRQELADTATAYQKGITYMTPSCSESKQ